VHDVLATNRLRATDEMAVFGTHPYKRSSVLAWGFPDSVRDKRQRPIKLARSRSSSRAILRAASAGATALWRKELRGDASAVRTIAPYHSRIGD
jgi:hypothetical protein